MPAQSTFLSLLLVLVPLWLSNSQSSTPPTVCKRQLTLHLHQRDKNHAASITRLALITLQEPLCSGTDPILWKKRRSLSCFGPFPLAIKWLLRRSLPPYPGRFAHILRLFLSPLVASSAPIPSCSPSEQRERESPLGVSGVFWPCKFLILSNSHVILWNGKPISE